MYIKLYFSNSSLASFSPYFLLYGRNPDLPTTIHRELSEVVNLDDQETWLKVCSQHAKLFQRVMPIAFENLPLLNTKIHCGMQLSEVEVIDH